MFAFIVACWLVATATAASPVVLHVAPDGNDAWSGKPAKPNADNTDGPLASLTGARDAIRKHRAANPDRSRPVRVLVVDGTHELHKPLVLTPEDTDHADAGL